MRNKVEISVAGRKLKIGCPSGQESALFAAAAELDKRLAAYSDSETIATTEQAMTMVALNLAHDLLAANKQREVEQQETQNQISLLQETIEQALVSQIDKSA
ncbi:cell division protein ZapA [Thalassotalea euphylliae]|uniref:Cell division protein ZapA n=1 Tax=Thalassotalea euphylliae TaxID=1655234 RepID=A0A3E0TV24_9GAMM|nr:cell division protein ZapA [Thalassotalea euphylliae]REL27782.1 cell division protein ZapA [Thalassotalea euphylliae]